LPGAASAGTWLPRRTAGRDPVRHRTSVVRTVTPTATHSPAQVHTGWIIQVGAFPAEGEAKQRLSTVQSKASRFLASANAFTETVSKGDSTLYRARFAGLGKSRRKRRATISSTTTSTA